MTVDYLVWDQADAMETRINRVLDEGDLGFRGFKESVIMKLLAVCHPDRVLPVFPFTGDHGKARMLRELGLSVPPLSTSAGPAPGRVERRPASVTEPLFPGDAWASGPVPLLAAGRRWHRRRPSQRPGLLILS